MTGKERLIHIGEKLSRGQEEKKEEVSLLKQVDSVLKEAKESEIFLAYDKLCESLQLNGYEKLLICLLWYRQTETNTGISFSEMKKLLAPYEGLQEGDALSVCFWQEQDEVTLSPVTMAFLEEKLPDFPKGIVLELPQVERCYDAERLLSAAGRMLELQDTWEQEPAALVLSGENGSGRHFVAQQTAARYGYALLKITEEAETARIRIFNDLLLCVQLYHALICVELGNGWDTAGTVQGRDLLRTGYRAQDDFVRKLSEYVPFILLIKEEGRTLYKDLGYALKIQTIELPDEIVKREIVRDVLKGMQLPGQLTVEMLSARQLPLGRFFRFIRNVRLELMLGTFDLEKNAFYSDSRHLTLLPANRSFAELKLPVQQFQQLEKICGIIGARKQVMKQWGYGRKYSYGNGISALFYGAPGTGKTMAAQAMANALGMPLFRVDISQLISKYIGETQKNIGKIFDEAKKCDGILLFDEADAVFAKRSEVTDSQDRYSNAETAYLLQRIEQHDGVSVLATNLLQNFDEAFRRRITYMLHFPMPDEEMRRQLWQSVFPKETSVSPDVDYELLGQVFELSGAAIRNASFHGACCAWAEGSDIQMRHLLDGIQNEYIKTGRTFSDEQRELLQVYLS